jgi:CRP-like cAMP-binding protein
MKGSSIPSQSDVSDLVVTKILKHATLAEGDEEALRALPYQIRSVAPAEDIVCQGNMPDVSVIVVSGMLGRYQTLSGGERQYLSFHIASDMPDVQALFLAVMDHSICAMDSAVIATIPHTALIQLFLRRPGLGFAFWRLTLIDAAIFRQAITNNGSRLPAVRLAHFCCELYFRAREQKLAKGLSCAVPLTQAQIGQALAMSHITVNRALQTLRGKDLLNLGNGRLTIKDWAALTTYAAFDPTYLHITKRSDVSKTPFKGRR